MMIVEFCKYGNLSNYLRSKREDFIVYKVSRGLRALDCFDLHTGECHGSSSVQLHLIYLDICALLRARMVFRALS